MIVLGIRTENRTLLFNFLTKYNIFLNSNSAENDSDSEWEPEGDFDDCSELESDNDGNVVDASDDGLWLVNSKKVSILLEYVF